MKLSKAGFSLFAGIAIIVSSCVPIELVSQYDETIDKETHQLQKKLDGYFTALRSSGTADDLKYKSQQKFYEVVLVDINAIQLRSGGVNNNNLTSKQVYLLKENFAYLTLLHKKCITGPLTEEQKDKVQKNGVDLSLDCKAEYGATTDSSGRGEEMINPHLIAPIQSQFNQHLGAVIALELAKKRGETTK